MLRKQNLWKTANENEQGFLENFQTLIKASIIKFSLSLVYNYYFNFNHSFLALEANFLSRANLAGSKTLFFYSSSCFFLLSAIFLSISSLDKTLSCSFFADYFSTYLILLGTSG